jgi:hypothetical protein
MSLNRKGVMPMKDKSELSRRKLLGQALSGAALVGAASVPAQALNRMNKVASKYQNHPNGDKRCALCIHFQPPHSCEVVPGNISPSGWCKWFRARKA